MENLVRFDSYVLKKSTNIKKINDYKFLKISFFVFFNFLILSSLTAQNNDKIKLPIEIFGSTSTTKKISFNLENASDIQRLFLKIHRPAYRNHVDIPSKIAKLSIRVNNEKWVDITDETTNVYTAEKSYGGIAGGYHTVRLTHNIIGLKNGSNTITFRFNGTDGFSTGLRIIGINLKKTDFVNIWNGSNFEIEDPTMWQAPLNNASDIAVGSNLWYNKQLKESSVNPVNINAKCTSCHAQDGRDLKYFNYSNYSIIERSKFHGLTEIEAKQIASYIRSLNTPAPKNAKPWNPPYQPGPGLDKRPVSRWAEGAGHKQVLEKDEEMLPFLFPKGTSQNNLAEVIDHSKTLNIREIPIAIQFPDWNSWLPVTHPLDIWKPYFYKNGDAYKSYIKARKELNEKGVNQLIASEILVETLDLLEDGIRDFMNKNSTNTKGKWRVQDGEAFDNINNGYTFEEAKLQLAKLLALHSWELVQEFNLEDKSTIIYGDQGEARSWPFRSRSVFNVAPHIVADNINNFPGQDPMVGDYFSTAWYQLQMTLNAGNKQPAAEKPVDWPYQQLHVLQLGNYTETPLNPLRYIGTQIKLFQQRVNANGSNRAGFELRSTHPWWLFSSRTGDTSLMDSLDKIESNLRNAIVEAFLRDFLRIVEHNPHPSFHPENWQRTDHESPSTSRWARVEPVDYVPVPYSGSGKLFAFPENYHADNFYRLLPRLQENNIDQQIINDLADWCRTMWPQGDWKSFKENIKDRAPLGKVIILKSNSIQKYVSINQRGFLLANKDNRGDAEKFKVEDAGNGYIALQSLTTNKVVRVNRARSDNPMIAQGDKIGTWMRLNWIVNQNQSISIKSFNTKLYALVDSNKGNNPILVTGEKIESPMEFNFEIVSETKDELASSLWRLENSASKLWIRPKNRAIDTNETVPLVFTNKEYTGNFTKFEFIPTDNAYYFIQNRGSNGRFRPSGCSLDQNDTIEITQVSKDTSDWCAQWKLVATDEEGFYRIQNRETGGWIRAKDCSFNTGDSVPMTQVSSQHTGICTKWRLIKVGELTARNFDATALSRGLINLYPNPASSFVQFSTNSFDKLVVFNSNGSEVLVLENRNKENKLDISKFPDGLYFVKIYNENGSILVKKLQVNKK
ncbi:T9SS type A sorting domain-containing protein [Aquimarina sp. Aq107]|uniref:T9SS type A sorting domain-containing protein n=1 Tax=Aquimarina sp. Aq107 TaxID=1191912 RepID=UPI000D5605DE|nr:T9SS type A sorting domain-containing protein [Aquimarina sp. Aq107]